MTKEAINDFAKAMQSDEEMSRGLAAAIGQKQGAEAAEAFAAYARDHGHAVTSNDVEALLAAASPEEGALSDDELEGVAGGTFFRDILGLVPGAMFGVATLAGAAVDFVAPKKF